MKQAKNHFFYRFNSFLTRPPKPQPGKINTEISNSTTSPLWLFQYSKEKIILLCILAFYFSLLLISLPDRAMHIDEPILEEQVYWLLKEGKVKSVLFTGIGTGLEDQLLVYHKAFIWISAAVSILFDLSLPLLRSLSLIFSLVLCFLLYNFCQKEVALKAKKDHKNLIFYLSLILLVSHYLFFRFSFLYRPEILQTLTGFGSFYLLNAFLNSQKKRHLIPAAFLAGFSVLVHLNGLIFVGAGFLLLLSKRRFKASFYFSGVAVLVSSLYAIDMLGKNELSQFILQFSKAPAFRTSDLDIWYRIGRMLNEHKRYFHSPLEGSFSILFILTVSFQWKKLWKNHSTLILYLFFASFSLAVINQGYTNKYALPLLPYAVLLMAISFFYLLEQKREKLSKILIIAFVIHAGIQLFYLSDLMSRRVDIAARNAEISSHILPEGQGKRVFATATFFSNEGKNYHMISTQPFLAKIGRDKEASPTKEDFFSHINDMSCEYVVIDFLFQNYTIHEIFRPNELKPGNAFYNYKITHFQNDYLIMKRIP